jgi:hypothetical protein
MNIRIDFRLLRKLRIRRGCIELRELWRENSKATNELKKREMPVGRFAVL